MPSTCWESVLANVQMIIADVETNIETITAEHWNLYQVAKISEAAVCPSSGLVNHPPPNITPPQRNPALWSGLINHWFPSTGLIKPIFLMGGVRQWREGLVDSPQLEVLLVWFASKNTWSNLVECSGPWRKKLKKSRLYWSRGGLSQHIPCQKYVFFKYHLYIYTHTYMYMHLSLSRI